MPTFFDPNVKWGPSPTFGTTGGVVTWSITAAGTDFSPFTDAPSSTVDLASFLPADYVQQIRAAFLAWSAVADIVFVQVADNGGATGVGRVGDIRVGGTFIDGDANTLAAAFSPDPGEAIAGDIGFDSAENHFWTSRSLFQVAAHEIGHSIGLNHTEGVTALMNSIHNPALDGLQPDDIAGANAIYGPTVPNRELRYALPFDAAVLTLLEELDGLIVDGNSLANVITGGVGDETLNGLAGDDQLAGGAGNDTLAGGDGNDTLHGDAGSDVMDGGAGNDGLAGGDGDDTLRGGAGSDGMDGGAGNDGLAGGDGNDTLIGGAGADALDGGAGTDSMSGGTGDDNYTIDSPGDNVTENPGEGTDTITAMVSGYTLAGNVEIGKVGTASGLALTGHATQNSALFGNIGGDTLIGGAGNDQFAGGLGDDTLNGGGGNDAIGGDGGNDTLRGEGGDDELFGGAGQDTLIGGAGNDTLDGGTGIPPSSSHPVGQHDFMLGGIGSDTYRVDNTFDLVDEGGAFPAFAGSTADGDTIVSTADWFWDVYSVGERFVIAEDAAGAALGSTMVASIFNNDLVGNSKTNVMFGRGGADTYRAGDGVDFISLSLLGVNDANAYVGVNGANTIIVEKRSSGPLSYDIVFEFESNKDKLNVSNYGYASAAEVMARGVNDGLGNSYFAFGDGFDYLYIVGLTTSQLSAGDFIV